MMMYDVCVVGAGMTGSAAARWVSQSSGVKVCLIGPREPTEQEWDDTSRTVFGAHYDQSRIVSTACTKRRDATWPVLTSRSIGRFRQLEQDSGIPFFEEVGCLFISSEEHLTRIKQAVQTDEEDITFFQGDDISRSFPHFKPSGGDSTSQVDHAVLERNNAGYINPRGYVDANKKVARTNGCEIIDDVVCKVEERLDEDSGTQYMGVMTKSGREVLARRVLLCAGAFTNFEDLLPGERKIDIATTTEVMVLLEIDDDDMASLASLPCTLIKYIDVSDPRNTYFAPPVKYPDGRYYVKVGHGFDLNRTLISHDDVTSWYRTRSDIPDATKETLTGRLFNWVKEFKPKSVRATTCVITTTPTDRYYCDMMTPTLGIVTGGNSAGANIADEIGRMGALMIVRGSWDHDLPAELFKLRFREKES